MSHSQDGHDLTNSQRYNYQAQHRGESSRTNNQAEDRYSWVDIPQEEQSILQTPAAYRHSPSVPSLADVPEHLVHESHQDDQDIARRSQNPSQSRIEQYPASQQHHRHPSHRQDLSKQQEAALYQISNHDSILPAYSLEPVHEHQQLLQGEEHEEHVEVEEYQGAQSQSKSQSQSEVYRQPLQIFESTLAPKTTLQNSEPDPEPILNRQTIHGEDNPLIPVSPSDPYLKTRSLEQTPSLSIFPPTSTDYHFASYTPAAQPITGGTWIHNLFSCIEPSVCLTGLFCPCILYGRVQHRIHLRADMHKDATNLLGHSTINGACMAWAVLCSCGISGILSGIQRTRVRRAYEMGSDAGNVSGDCLEGCCCCCCVLAQNEKEIVYREERGKMGLGRGGTQGYVSPDGMSFGLPPR